MEGDIRVKNILGLNLLLKQILQEFWKLSNCLSADTLTGLILCKNMWLFLYDGAAIMVGRKNGVVTLLQQGQPSLVVIHCFAHRLELAGHGKEEQVVTGNSKRIMELFASL